MLKYMCFNIYIYIYIYIYILKHIFVNGNKRETKISKPERKNIYIMIENLLVSLTLVYLLQFLGYALQVKIREGPLWSVLSFVFRSHPFFCLWVGVFVWLFLSTSVSVTPSLSIYLVIYTLPSLSIIIYLYIHTSNYLTFSLSLSLSLSFSLYLSILHFFSYPYISFTFSATSISVCHTEELWYNETVCLWITIYMLRPWVEHPSRKISWPPRTLKCNSSFHDLSTSNSW